MTYDQVADQLIAAHPEVIKSQMFGMACLKAGGKVLAGDWKGVMVFKLPESFESALKIDGATLFDHGMGRPMKNWVGVPQSECDQWPRLAEAAWIEREIRR